MRASKRALSLLLCTLFALQLSACALPYHPQEGPSDPPQGDVPSFPPAGGEEEERAVRLHAYAGATVDLCPEEVRAYLTLEDPDAQAAYLEGHLLQADGQAPAFSWEGDGSELYTIYFSTDANFENSVSVQTTQVRIEDFGAFIPGKEYFWKVEGESGCSETDSFVATDLPVRCIEAEGADNVRDIGGWDAAGGKRVKYGMIYRGGQLNGYAGMDSLTERGKRVFSGILGIRSEIDLRTPGRDDGGQNSCWWSDSATYLKADFTQYCMIFPGFLQTEPYYRGYDEDTVPALQKIFALLSDEKNYPVYIHCNAGADRTGTLIFLINGLLGVSYEDLTRDFELTSFSYYGKRWRSAIEGGKFTESGVMEDSESNYVAWGKMYEIMMREYSQGGPLSEAVERYFVTVCGISVNVLERVKEILLED